ncbi:MAG: flavin reductase family protein [Candidatus Muiribacteriaceae bacterium]
MKDKKSIGTNIFINPMPVVLIGSRFVGEANFMTCSWVTRVNAAPPMIGISLNKNHQTSPAIMDCNEFSVNIPDKFLLEKTDYAGEVSGKKKNKAALFDVFYGKLEKAPMIAECPVNIECRLVKTLELPSNTFFVGEIINTHVSSEYIRDGNIDMEKFGMFCVTMPDNHYRAVGDVLGKAWDVSNFEKFK